MNRTVLSIDLKSFAIGVFLTVVFGVFFGGFWQSKAAGEGVNAIAADNEGVYIFNQSSIRYIDKAKCRTEAGCSYFTR
ncbi:MAG: hypothetical protein H7Z37_00985 [Pyrinomonadaceae bacterium]|nr:hypothetical protein [Pyrinomonadaceae bacterium]